MDSNFNPYWEWLKIPANQQPPSHYRLLGLKPLESDTETIDAAVNRLVEKMQRLSNGPQVEATQKILNQVAQARLCFGDPAKKQIYDRQLIARLATQPSVHSTAAPAKPKPETVRPSNPGRPAESPRKLPAAASTPATAKPKPESVEKVDAGNRRIRLMRIATAAMLVLGSIVGSLFVWFVFGTPSARPVAQRSLTMKGVESANSAAIKNPDTREQMFAQPPVNSDSAGHLSATPNSQMRVVQPQTDVLSQVANSTTVDLGVDPNQPSLFPAASTVPANGLQTIHGTQDTYIPVKSELFDSCVDAVVGLQGQAVKARVSKSGKTVYLMFSQAENDLIELRASAKKVSLDGLKAFVGKTISVRGEIKREFGSRRIGLEVVTLDQIEIVE